MILVQYVSVFVIRLFYIKGKILIFFLCQKYISTIKGKISCFLFSQKFKIWLTIIKYSQIYYNKNITKLQNRYFSL